MSGYNPAGYLSVLTSPKLNWFQRWNQRRRDRKADRKRNWIKLLSALCMSSEEINEFWIWLDLQSTDFILQKKSHVETSYLSFCQDKNAK